MNLMALSLRADRGSSQGDDPRPRSSSPCCSRARRWLRGRDNDAGYATAEAAVVLPVLLTVLALAVWVLVCVNAQLRCVDAARAAARVAARGDSASTSARAGRALSPPGAHVQIRVDGSQVRVEVTAQVRPFGAVLRLLPAVRVDARAVAELEDARGLTP